MDKSYIQEQIIKLSSPNRSGMTKETGWYQEISLQGVMTTRNSLSCLANWKRIRSLMASDLTGLKVLDIGCNAGLFSLMAALEGASCIAIDDKEVWLNQAKFVKEVLEEEFKTYLPVVFMQLDVGQDRFTNFEMHFDYALAIGVAAELCLAHGERKFSRKSMEAQDNLLADLAKLSSNVIIRSREKTPGMASALYDKVFSTIGWSCRKRIPDTSPDILLSLYSNG